MIPKSFQMEDVLSVVFILEVVGVCLTFERLFAVVKYVGKVSWKAVVEDTGSFAE